MQQQKWNELDELIIVIILRCYKIIFVMKNFRQLGILREKKWH